MSGRFTIDGNPGDRILVPLPDGRWLALDAETFVAALEAGTEYMASPSTASASAGTAKLIDATQLSERTGIPATWFEAQARERRIPFRKLGRYVRFDYEEVLGAEAFQRRVIRPGEMNCTGSHDRKARANA